MNSEIYYDRCFVDEGKPHISVVNEDFIRRINALLLVLAEAGVLDDQLNSAQMLIDMPSEQFNEHVKNLSYRRFDAWCADDVMTELDEDYPHMTRDEGLMILKYAIDNFDATTGVNWDCFQSAANEMNFEKMYDERLRTEESLK